MAALGFAAALILLAGPAARADDPDGGAATALARPDGGALAPVDGGTLERLDDGALARADERPCTEEFDCVLLGNVEVRGLWRTVPSVIARELPWDLRAQPTPDELALGIARLWNTGLFAHVDGHLAQRGERQVVVLALEEKISLVGIFVFTSDGTTGWLQVGLRDVNFAGRFLEIGGLYERFGSENGGELWLRDPRLFDRRLDGVLEVEHLSRPRPGFTLIRSRARLEVAAEPSDELRLGGFADALSDRFGAPLEGPANLPSASGGAIVGGSVRLGRVDTVRLREHGVSLELRPYAGAVGDPVSPRFASATAALLMFAMPGEAWTLALRALFGALTAAPLQHRFYFGGVDALRGYPDNYLRATRYALANGEVRWTAFDSTWFALMPTAFLDIAAAYDAGTPGVQGALDLGLGVRLLCPKFVRSGLRLDLAATLLGPRALGPSIGVYQLF